MHKLKIRYERTTGALSCPAAMCLANGYRKGVKLIEEAHAA
jgi:hypothetical protein